MLEAMKAILQFKKDGLYVQIAGGMSEGNIPIWMVESNVPDKELREEFHEIFPQSDHQRYENLRKLMFDWAERKGYEQTI
jgi:hypothetical protein